MLDQEHLARFKKRLEAARADLKEQITTLGESPEFGSDVDEFEEEAEEAEEFSKNAGLADAMEKRLENVEHALGKIASGTYGTCEACKKPIEMEVLNVDPESRLCRACKEKERA